VGVTVDAADAPAAGLAATTTRRTETTTCTGRLVLDIDACHASGLIDKAVQLIIALQILNLMGLRVFTLLAAKNLSQDAHITRPFFTRDD
jgi:hypothetical protein